MTPQIPVELAHARAQRDAAWRMLAEAEGGDNQNGVRLYEAARAWTQVATDWYNRWQAVGGTSDITSIVEAEQADPRTPEQRDLDAWQAETAATREGDRLR